MRSNLIHIMKIILTLAFTLFFLLYLNAQSLTAIYKQNIKLPEKEKPTDEKNAKRYERHQHLLNETKNLTDQLKYKLIFNNNKAVFSMKNIMLKDESHHLMSLANIYSKGIFYNDNTNKKRIWNTKAFGENYVIDLPLLEWNISNEEESINGYICNKAIAKKTSYNKGEKYEKDVVAWYTNEIPVSYGPVGYSGLPGLIVKLEILDRVFTLQTVHTKENIPIDEPKDGKKIDLKEYYGLFEKANNNLSTK